MLSRIRKLEKQTRGQEWMDPTGWNLQLKEAIEISKKTGQYPATRAGQLVRKMDLAGEQMESLYTVEWPPDEEEAHDIRD